MQVINCRGQHSRCKVNYLSTDSKTYTLLRSLHNDADDTDNTGVTHNAYNADDCNRVFGIAQLKAVLYQSKTVDHYNCNVIYGKLYFKTN